MDDTSFRLLLGLAGVAFGAIQLYFRSELKAVTEIKDRFDKFEYRLDTYKESVKNLFQTHVGWVQKEFSRFADKCEQYRSDIESTTTKLNGDTKTDAKEIVQLHGEIKLISQKLEVIEQFFYESRSLWDSKADIIKRIESLEYEVNTLTEVIKTNTGK